jgi:regulator of protease activity HflC (stomatin/prohibitin superfamily)
LRLTNTSLALLTIAIVLGGCTRIETGEVGLRQNFSKTWEADELLPGSFNQTVIGSVQTFKIQDVAVEANNLTPLASDNSTIKDFDVTAIYSINPKAVNELWTGKNKSFHVTEAKTEDILLMQNYVMLALRNAAYKAARGYPSLKLSDNRALLEVAIREQMTQTFAAESLADKIMVSQVQIRSVLPADSIVESANALVRAQNELATKEVEVQTAVKEAQRISALNSNAKAIDYMNAQANFMIAEGVKSGKVHTIVVPFDFKGIVQTPAAAK